MSLTSPSFFTWSLSPHLLLSHVVTLTHNCSDTPPLSTLSVPLPVSKTLCRRPQSSHLLLRSPCRFAHHFWLARVDSAKARLEDLLIRCGTIPIIWMKFGSLRYSRERNSRTAFRASSFFLSLSPSWGRDPVGLQSLPSYLAPVPTFASAVPYRKPISRDRRCFHQCFEPCQFFTSPFVMTFFADCPVPASFTQNPLAICHHYPGRLAKKT